MNICVIVYFFTNSYDGHNEQHVKNVKIIYDIKQTHTLSYIFVFVLVLTNLYKGVCLNIHTCMYVCNCIV